MASQQIENGYTKIANEILEALCLIKLPEYERIVLQFIIRKTYGFNKKEDRISNSQITTGTGIRKQHAYRTIQSLKEKNLVTCKGNKIGIQKDWEKWKVTWRGYQSNLYGLQKVTSTGTTKAKSKKQYIC